MTIGFLGLMIMTIVFFLLPELNKTSSDPAYNINLSGDIKQMLKELGTETGKEIALHGGGGNKAQTERAAALTAILAARSRIKEDSKSNESGEVKAPAYSIVDAASAAVHGRSAAAARAAPQNKTAARIAMFMAGDRTPVNAKLVSFPKLQTSMHASTYISKVFLIPLDIMHLSHSWNTLF